MHVVADAQAMTLARLGAQAVGEIDFERYALPETEAAKVKSATEWTGDLLEYFSQGSAGHGCVLPWGKTHASIKLRKGELSIWAGVNGHGKSLLHSMITYGLVRQQQSVCIASLEMKPVQTLIRMCRQATGVEVPTGDYITRFASSLASNLWLYDQQGTVKSKNMLAVVRYCREELEIDHFVIDSLMKCGMGADDYNAQKYFVDALSTYAKDSGLHVHLIAHSRKKETEHKHMDKFDVKGASEITDMADNVFTLWRNKGKEEKAQKGELKAGEADMPDAVLNCDKQRNGDWEGKISLWFVPRALQYVAKATSRTIDLMQWPFTEEA